MSQVRVSRKDFIVPRCTNACPAGVDVPRYIRAVKDGRYDDAVAVLRERIPFPTVCADACFAPCEDECAYKQFGDPIAIRALKRAAVDNGGDAWKNNQKKASSTGKKVAVIGAGPAGLTSAYYLSLQGHDVTVFDEFPQPGGMMRYGIPKYRLPQERLDKDVAAIMDLGVTFKGETSIGGNISLEDIKKDFDAVFIASGANSSAQIPLEGRDMNGVLWGWDFLRDVALGKDVNLGKEVVVVGGGNVAIDVALTAKRMGARDVSIVCLESREEMPAHPWEIKLAEEEGVIIHNAWAPKMVLGDSVACGIGLMRCTSVFDDACSFNPVYDEMITHKIDAENIILAIGQAPVLEFVGNGVEVKANRITADPDTLATSAAGVFAGGDVVTGPQSIIGGIAQGRQAAESIDKYLGGKGDIAETLAPAEDEILLPPMEQVIRSRNEMAHLAPWARAQGFDQVEQGLTAEQVKAEASRCLNCDARKFEVVLDTEKCKECGYCAEVCGVETFGPAESFNAKGYRPMEVKSADWCVGCFKCFFSCPDFAIDVRELTA
jgi:formate dehydrogenase beta subunit